MPPSSKETNKDENKDEEQPTKDIKDPLDTDVLQGRGGAALRHAGNQTYRKLVNLNKRLYSNCLKTEKLKISRSIVAAIREQKGRFLQRDAKTGLWFDIGDKKAVEKTSQALREGQAKLRDRVERSQITDEQPNVQEKLQQEHGNGIYNARATHENSNPSDGSMQPNMNLLNDRMNSGMSVSTMGMGSLGRMASVAASLGSDASGISFSSMLDSVQKPQTTAGRSATGQGRNNMAQMPRPPSRSLSTSIKSMSSFSEVGGNNDTSMLQNLSLEPRSIPSWTPSIGSIESLMTMSTGGGSHNVPRRTIPRQHNRYPSYGSHNNNHNSSNNYNVHTMQSITSDSSGSTNSNINDNLSAFGMNIHSIDGSNGIEPNLLTEKIGSFDPKEPRRVQQQIQHQPQQLVGNGDHAQNEYEAATGVKDRRRYFAKMHSGLADINMVDSQFSLMSILSAQGSKHRGQNTDMDISRHSRHGLAKKDSMGSEYIGVGSRRSLMSGISRLSGHSSDIHNAFSNLAKTSIASNDSDLLLHGIAT